MATRGNPVIIQHSSFSIHRSFFIALLLLLAGCTPARLAVYSRPGGAEVHINDRLVARTVNEATPVRIDMPTGAHRVKVVRDGFEPWEREVTVRPNRVTPVMADLTPVPPPPRYVPVGALEIRTEPGLARIFLDGKEIGRSQETPRTPVRLEKMAPGSYVVRVEKEGFQPFEERYDVFANQTTRAALRLFPLTPYYCYPTNDDLLRQTALRAVRGVAHLPGMRSDRTLVIVNLEGDRDPENRVRALIEDALIAELAQKGRAVLEREDHLLVRIANEAARGGMLTLDVLTRHEGPRRPFVYDARLRTVGRARVVTTGPDGRPREILIDDLAAPPTARIPTADQIFGYKIVEKSLRADPVEEEGAIEPMTRRQATLRLYVRLVDARTGIVQWAERFEASLVDRVPTRVYRWLAAPPQIEAWRVLARADAAADAARQPEIPRDEPIEHFTSRDLDRLNDLDALFWYSRNIGESYLRAGRLEDAIRLLAEAVRLRPDDYEARMFLAEAHLRAGDFDAANRAWLEAYRRLTAPRAVR